MPRTGSCVSCSTASWKLVKRWCADVFLNFVVPESSRLLTRLCRHELAAPPALSAETRLCTQEPAVGVLLDEAPLAIRQTRSGTALGAELPADRHRRYETRDGSTAVRKLQYHPPHASVAGGPPRHSARVRTAAGRL